MISIDEAIKIFKEYRDSGYILGGYIVDGFGYVFEGSQRYIDDSIVIVGFDGAIKHMCAFPPDPSEEFIALSKAKQRRIPRQHFKPAGRVLFSYHYESCWGCFDKPAGRGYELYYDGSLYKTTYMMDVPYPVEYVQVGKCVESAKQLKKLFANRKMDIDSIPEDIFGGGCDGGYDHYKFASKRIRVYLSEHPLLSEIYKASLDILKKEYPGIEEIE